MVKAIRRVLPPSRQAHRIPAGSPKRRRTLGRENPDRGEQSVVIVPRLAASPVSSILCGPLPAKFGTRVARRGFEEANAGVTQMPKFLLFVSTMSAASVVAGAALASPDQTFLTKALMGDNSEMALGQMAQQRGASAATRDFGRMLNEDHAAAKAKALPVAQQHGVADTSEMAPEAKAEAKKLGTLSGPAFDREFARYMVRDHTKDIADFEKESKRGDSASAALARETLPDLRKHLKTAQQLASR
jgi:putative membrane protein